MNRKAQLTQKLTFDKGPGFVPAYLDWVLIVWKRGVEGVEGLQGRKIIHTALCQGEGVKQREGWGSRGC